MSLEKFSSLAKKAMTPISMKTLLDSGTGRLLGRSVSAADTIFKSERSFSQMVDPTEFSDMRKELRKLARLQIASFLRREIPVRLSHRIFDLAHFPYGIGKMPSIQGVQHNYMTSCEEVLTHPEEFEDDQQLRKILSKVYARHNDTLVEVARGLQEFQRSEQGRQFINSDFSSLDMIHLSLDNFFLSRIGIRVLIGHYLELHNNSEYDSGDNPYHKDLVGIIDRRTSPASVIMDAARDAKYMCERQYGDSPEVEILGRTDLTFAYVPSHLYYILFELLKNSMRAVAEHHRKAKILPEIKVIVADGEENEDVVIKISDLGGGIARSDMKKIFSYLFTTAGPVSENLDGLEDFGRENPLAGLGYGLPIARLYVKYFGGDLQLKSIEGHGTDSFLHLSRLTNNEEPLP